MIANCVGVVYCHCDASVVGDAMLTYHPTEDFQFTVFEGRHGASLAYSGQYGPIHPLGRYLAVSSCVDSSLSAFALTDFVRVILEPSSCDKLSSGSYRHICVFHEELIGALPIRDGGGEGEDVQW
jgi:hypothetical protein